MFKKGEKEKVKKRDMTKGRNEELFEASSSTSSPPSVPEIPQPSCISNFHHHRKLAGDSLSRVSLRSSPEHSPTSSFSNGFCSSDDGSPFSSPPFGEPAKYFHRTPSTPYSNGLFNHFKKIIDDKNLVDDLGMCENLCRMNIRDEEDKGFMTQTRRSENDPYGFGSRSVKEYLGFNGNRQDNVEKQDLGTAFNSGAFAFGGTPYGIPSGVSYTTPTTLFGMQGEGNTKGFSLNDHNLSNDSCFILSKAARSIADTGIPLQNRPDISSNPYLSDAFVHSQQFGLQSRSRTADPFLSEAFIHSGQQGLDLNGGRGFMDPLVSPELVQPAFSYGVNRALDNSPLFSEGTIAMPTDRVPQSVDSVKGIEPLSFEDSLIIQGKTLNCAINNQLIPSKGHKRNTLRPLNSVVESGQTLMGYGDMEMRPSLVSMPELEGHVYLMSKDQNGCRFLQRIFDEGTPLDVLIIFNEVIDHVIELMMDSFGNYLVQKLLDVCTEEQRTKIVLVVTAEPGKLVRISLNTYGTRVVQKLVETLRTRKQISLVKSALKPGLLDLTKDLNGNHVIQRCLQCLSTEDNKFIYDAAANFCIDIATHRHGCCVLQRCIAHSIGQQRDKLIAEISRNSLLLAQDPFGNYVVQYLIDLKIPSAISILLSQFKGHYVQLSTQKFSSHVVERCLNHCGDSGSQIIHELISVPHFDQLLQDPFANFVIQAALNVTKGHLHALLVEAIRPHWILRNNPYCKRIFSRALMKK